MSSNLGDIVVTAGIDSRKWYEEAAALGRSAKGLGGQIHEGLSGKGSLVVDTISATLSGGIGGASGTVTKAIEGYLSKFGAFGAATSLVVGVGVAAAIASLERQNKAFEQTGESVATATTRLDAFIDRQREMASFRANVERLDTSAGADRTLTDLDARISGARGLDQQLAREERGLERDLAVARQSLEVSKINADENFFTSLLGFEDATVPFQKAVDDITARIEAVRGRRSANAVGLGSAEEQRTMLADERANIEMRSRAAEAQKIREADPFFGTQVRLEKIRGLVDSGFLEKDIGARSAQRIFNDFARTAIPDTAGLRNDANIAGTASAFSALQASLRQDRAPLEAMSSTATQQLDTLKQILSAIKGTAGEQPGEDL